MKESKSFSERDYIFVVKAFALLSIVAAHVATVPQNTPPWNVLLGNMLSSIGSIGVGVFFLFSGYLYFRTTKTFYQFFYSKIRTILIPWSFCGTLLFLYVALRKGGLNFYNWFTTLTVFSHLYYLTVLMIFYLLFWKLRNNNRFLIVISCLSVISITLTGQELLDIYPYINPLNWAIYFILGLLIRKYNLLEKLALFCKKWLAIICSIYVFILMVYLSIGIYISYWKHAAIIAELFAIALVLGVSSYCSGTKKANWFVYLGKMSFSVYLLHTPFAGIITNFFNRFHLWYFTLFRPFIVILMTLTGIEMVRYLSKKIKVNKIADILLGVYKTDRSRI